MLLIIIAVITLLLSVFCPPVGGIFLILLIQGGITNFGFSGVGLIPIYTVILLLINILHKSWLTKKIGISLYLLILFITISFGLALLSQQEIDTTTYINYIVKIFSMIAIGLSFHNAKEFKIYCVSILVAGLIKVTYIIWIIGMANPQMMWLGSIVFFRPIPMGYDPNYLCGEFLLPFGIAFGLAIFESFKPYRFLYIMASIYIGYSIFITLSRGGVLGIVLAILVSFIISIIYNSKSVFNKLIKVFALLSTFSILIYGTIITNINQKFTIGNNLDATDARFNLWQNAIGLISINPWKVFFGLGPDAYLIKQAVQAHNSYITIFTDFGILTFLILIYTQIIILKYIYNKIKYNYLQNTVELGFLVGIFSGFIAQMLLYSTITGGFQYNFWFFLSGGIILCSFRDREELIS